MKLNINNNLNNNQNNFNINDFIKELTERLKIMERELVVDRFENGYAVCEDRKTKEMYNIEISDLPENAKEGSVLKFENGKYVIDEKVEKEISDRIKEKMDDLWN